MQVSQSPLPNGTLLYNRYRILNPLGQGGMSRVYLAQDIHLNLRVAVKENLQTEPQARTQFQREAELLAHLSHPNLPRVIDHFDDPATRRQYLVMDYVEGEDLEAMVKRVGPLPEQSALAWIRQILGALEYLHTQTPPVIHRDIKPSNIKITPQGKAVLVDFGIAKVFDPSAATMTGARAVTPGYAPPEQYGMRTDERSDIYSLGATLYTVLTGRVPPEAPLRMSDAEPLIPPRQIAPNVSPHVEGALLRALEVSSTKRWHTAGELRAALESPRPMPRTVMQTTRVSAPQTATVAADRSNARAGAPFAVLAATAALVVGIAIIGGLIVFVGTALNSATGGIASTTTPTDTDTSTPAFTFSPTPNSTRTRRPTSTPIKTRTPAPTRVPSATPVPRYTGPNQVRLLAVSPPPGTQLKNGQPTVFQVPLHYDLGSRDNAILGLYIEQFPSSAGGCTGSVHHTNGGIYVSIVRGQQDISVQVSWPGDSGTGYVSPGVSFWPDAGGHAGSPIIKAFGTFPDYCYPFGP